MNWYKKIKTLFTKIWFLWLACLAFNIITFLFIYFKISPGNKTLALHYNILVGVDRYGSGKNLYFLPGIGLVISAVNFVLYRAFKDGEDFLAGLTVLVSLCVQMILLAATLFLSTVTSNREYTNLN